MTMTVSQRVQVVFLYHPYADLRVSPAIPAAILKRLAALYGSPKNILVGQIRYGLVSSSTAQRIHQGHEDAFVERHSSPRARVSAAPFVSIDQFSKQLQRHLQPNDDLDDVGSSALSDSAEDVQLPRSQRLWTDALDDLWTEASSSALASTSSERKEDATSDRRTVACLADGLVAAVEMFSRYNASSFAIPLARYIVHVVPSSCVDLGLDVTLYPHSNLDSQHDKWTWARAAAELGKMSVWPSSIAMPTPGGPPINAVTLTPDVDQIQKAISDKLPSTLPSFADTPSIVGPMFKNPFFTNCLRLSGLSDAAATAAKAAAAMEGTLAGRKRGRRHSLGLQEGDQPSKTNASLATSDVSSTQNGSTSSTQTSSLPTGRPMSDADKQAIQKVLFLQQQQQMMMRNLKILKQQEEEKVVASGSPTRSRLLDQFREQLIKQHDALRSHYVNLNATITGGAGNQASGDGTAAGAKPTLNLNESLQALITIDRAATEKGIHLGGPSTMQALVQRHRQQLIQQQQGQRPDEPAKASEASQLQALVGAGSTASALSGAAGASAVAPAASSASASSTMTAASQAAQANPALDGNAASAQQVRRPGIPAVWAGAITWNMALPNKQRNAAATFVAALCAPNTKPESLMLPWPQRFIISEVQSVSLSSLQQYASSNAIPCIMFNPRPLPPVGPGGVATTPASNQNNETMYTMLARMIDSKRGCAFMKLQDAVNAPSEAGIVIVPTSQPGNGSNRRLLGLVFRHAVPWHLFAPQQAALSTASSNAGQTSSSTTLSASQDSSSASSVSLAAGVSDAQRHAAMMAAKAPHALFQQQQPQTSTPQQQALQASQGTGTPRAASNQATPLPPSLGNLNALSASQLSQQSSAWAAAQAQTQTQSNNAGANLGFNPQGALLASLNPSGNMTGVGGASSMMPNAGAANAVNPFAVPSNAPASGASAAMGSIDFGALAAQLNLAVRPQSGAQPQQANNGSGFDQGMWGANATKQLQQSMGNGNNIGASQQAPSTADFEALQRILGLNSAN